MDVLRDYLYVDLEKVKGLASQLYEGVPEATEASSKKTTGGQIGSRNLAFINAGRESDVMDRKDVVDALFPAIERDLEAEGYLDDISDIIDRAENFHSGQLREDFPAGCIVRMSAPGRLVDPRYFARTMVGLATAANGLQALDSTQQPVNQSARSKPKGQAVRKPLEQDNEGIPEIPAVFNISTAEVRGMVKVMRGVYPEGVSMVLSPSGAEGPVISIRLQEGRQHLDADPETLFARYGLGLQEWTVVGMIGYHAEHRGNMEEESFVHDDGRVNRGKMTEVVNGFLEYMSVLGLVEMPQAPGFSVVPIAVYRVIPRSVSPNRGSGPEGDSQARA